MILSSAVQITTVDEGAGCLLVGNSYSNVLSFNCNGSSVIFEVPRVEGRNLRSVMCIAYSSTPNNIAPDVVKNVLVINYTKVTIQLYKTEALASLEDENGKRVVSSMEPRNKVEVVVVIGNGFIVKKTIIYLIYDGPVEEKMEQCQAPEENDIVCIGDENVGAGSCSGFIKHSFRHWITNFMCRLVECWGK